MTNGNAHKRTTSYEALERLVSENLTTAWRDGNVAKRGQHGKHHAYVHGTFRVLDSIPKELRAGIFQPACEYPCDIRFSNGSETDDRKRDVRGLAIKLHGIEGVKLLPGKGYLKTQDFLLADHPTYLAADMADYVVFNRHFTPIQALRRNGFSFGRLAKAVRGLAMLAFRHRRILRDARNFAGRRPSSLLSLTYHSTTPYALGDALAVKYKVIGKVSEDGNVPETRDNLSKELWEHLSANETKFDFGVVIQKDFVANPVNDASVDWEAAGAKFVKLAEINLPRQSQSVEKDRLAETSMFSPWMCLAEHRPLGDINLARLWVYSAMASRRRHLETEPNFDS